MKKIRKRSQLVMDEGIKRGYSVTPLDADLEIFIVKNSTGHGFIYRYVPGLLSFKANAIYGKSELGYGGYEEKQYQKEHMAEFNMPTPETYGVYTDITQMDDSSFKYPLVIKPAQGSLSHNVFIGINNYDELIEKAGILFKEEHSKALVEQHVDGNEYRLIVANGKYSGCVQRRPAMVKGDGEHTIQQLIEIRNAEPERGAADAIEFTNHHLLLDHITDDLLEAAGYDLNTVLPAGEEFTLQNKVFAASGADLIDVTDSVHESYITPCIQLLEKFGLSMMGFDIITSDITKPIQEVNGVYNEYNLASYIDLVENCNIGTKHPVSPAIWDYIEAKADTLFTRHLLPF